MANSPAPPSHPDRARPLAFVVDDEPRVRAIVCKILASLGFATSEFAAPLPLTEAIKKGPPDLVVLDLALGQSDAVEVMRHLEGAAYQGKVLLISGRGYAALSEIHRIGEQHGLLMAPPVQKPFRPADIANSLAVELKNARAASPGEPKDEKPIRIDPAEALRNSWLRLWYQAKIDLRTMSVCGAEALLRAKHPMLGVVDPREFLPESRASTLYQPLTKFVVQQAQAHWEIFADAGQPLKLSINVPLATLQSPAFVELIRASLPRKPNFPGMIVEVTEGDMLLDPIGIREIATQLRLYNVAVSIDDFGSANSSLARLRDLPCAELKLDRSYVMGCATDSAKQSVCAAAIELAHGFGLTVCAKGVENVEDLRTLMDLGCHTAQGFLFAEPMGSAQFLAMLRGRAGAAQAHTASPPAVASGLKLTA